MSKEAIEFLKHILDECKFIQTSIGSDFKKEDLLSDETLKRAVVRSLEIIGEASKMILIDVKLKWNSISWKNISGMRDKLIHDYIGVNYSIVWDVVKNKIPELEKQIKEVINAESESE